MNKVLKVKRSDNIDDLRKSIDSILESGGYKLRDKSADTTKSSFSGETYSYWKYNKEFGYESGILIYDWVFECNDTWDEINTIPVSFAYICSLNVDSNIKDMYATIDVLDVDEIDKQCYKFYKSFENEKH